MLSEGYVTSPRLLEGGTVRGDVTYFFFGGGGQHNCYASLQGDRGLKMAIINVM